MLKIVPKVLAIMTVIACLPLAAPNLWAQGPEGSSQDYQRYRVDLKISELEKGKTLDTRSYVMVMAKNKSQRSANGRIRVGNRVPYPVNKEGSIQYQDVGMNIDCNLTPLDSEHVQADLTVDSSSLTHSQGEVSASSLNPVFRNLRWQGTPAVVIGKPTVVSEVDDVTSDHRYQIEMTVTEIK
jgi:hypothetical protein